MAASLRYFALSCCVFFAFHQVVTGLTCYDCTACGKHRDSWGTDSSLANGASCSKYTYSLGAVSYVDRRVRTSCSPGPDGLGGAYYCCSTDYCNGGVSLSSSLGLAFVLVAAVGLFQRVGGN